MTDSYRARLLEVTTLEGYAYRLWDYQASLSQLTVRARDPNRRDDDIYIVFQGVVYLQTPVYWEKGDFRLVSEPELQVIAERIGVGGLEPGSLLKADTPKGVVYVLGRVAGVFRRIDPTTESRSERPTGT